MHREDIGARARAEAQGRITLMCERLTRHYTWTDVHDLYGLTARKPQTSMPPRDKICPTATIDTVRLVAGRRVFEPMRWGFVPGWWLIATEPTNPATFNARVETVATAPFFRSAFKHKRCLLPASGYYDWRQTSCGKRRYYFTSRAGPVMTFAGLWDEWRNPETDELIHSCTIIVGEPVKVAAEQHDLMPVILKPTQFESWLSGQTGPELLNPADESMLNKHLAPKRINRSRASDTDDTSIEKVVPPR